LKKYIILLLAAALVLVPFSSLHGEEISLMDKYIEYDSVLSDLTENYNDLVDQREESIEFYENYRINRRNLFNIAMSQAAKENGLRNVDLAIDNALYDLKAREALLMIDFRKEYLSLMERKIDMDLANASEDDAGLLYNEAVAAHNNGYISDIDFLSEKYSYQMFLNAYQRSKRTYASELRSFNLSLGYDISKAAPVFSFDEDLIEVKELSEYLDSVMENSKELELLRQAIDRYETELYYLSKYHISENLSYYRDKRRSIDLNLELSKLMLEETEGELLVQITEKYNSLMIDREKLSLALLSNEILENDYNISLALYRKGLISSSELNDSKEALMSGNLEYTLMVYKYNTNVMRLEYDCSCFFTEDGE